MALSTASVARLKAWIPPAAIRAYWRLRPRFHYSERGILDVSTPGSTPSGWHSDAVVEAERKKWELFRSLIASKGPLGFSHEASDLADVRNLYHHNVHLAYAYVLALAARGKTSLSVLDWGGGLGHYYLLARALVPDVQLDYHVKEMPGLVAAGRGLLKDVRWHDTDDALETSYDLVLINGSLQYMENWRPFVQRVATAVRGYLLLTRVPVVQVADRYAAIQSEYGTKMIHWQFRERDLLEMVDSTGLELVREILVGGSPYIRGAPEQPEMRGWLFRR